MTYTLALDQFTGGINEPYEPMGWWARIMELYHKYRRSVAAEKEMRDRTINEIAYHRPIELRKNGVGR